MTDLIVIGGGIIGMLTARELAVSGRRVLLLERGRTGQESSWAGGGILSPLYPWRYDDAVTELARWSQKHYETLADELLAETGIDPEYLHSGMIMLNVDAREQETAAAWAENFEYTLERLDQDSIHTLEPHLGRVSGHALWMPQVGQMRNPRLVQALRKSIEQLGVELHEQSSVEAIKVENGAVSGIRLAGEEIAASRVVLAAGAWSGELLSPLGITLELQPVRGQMLLFRAEPGVLRHVVLSGNHYLIPGADGRILAGSTLEYVGFDKATTERGREELLSFATALLPSLVDYSIEKQWSGLRPGTPDGVPYIGPCSGIEGLYVNAGHFRNGVVTGLASARLLADQILGLPPILDGQPYACS